MKKRTLIDLFENSVSKYSNNSVLLEKVGKEWQTTTYAEAHEIVMEIAGGLLSIGVKKDDKISILAEGCNNWILSELGLLYTGAISVPLSVKLEESNDLLFRLKHAEVSEIFVSRNQLDKLRLISDKLPLLKQIIIFDDEVELREGEMHLSNLRTKGREYLKQHREEMLEFALGIQNDDYATITYTSGTTADPKGVVLTHRNYTANVEQCLSQIDIPPTYKTLIILPLDHCFAHVVGFYIMIDRGATVSTVQVGKSSMETLRNIPINIREVEPDFLLSVPALAKSFRNSIESGIKAQGKITESMFKFALKVSYAYNKDGHSKGSGFSFLLKPLVTFFDQILYSKVRKAFGENLKFFIGGGALLDSELQRFFYAIGIPMFQGYGLSEATPVISTNSPETHKFGSSGRLLEPLEMKIVDENRKELPAGVKGEIVVRGENVMAGYWKNPEATTESIEDGWLYTGDMGYMSEDGYFYVLGRFKSLLISSDGEKYSPEGMEETISSMSPYIEQMIIYNDQNPYTTALIVPNMAAVQSKIGDLPKKEMARASVALIQSELDRFRSGGEHSELFPERWLPVTFALIAEPFSEANGLVNSTAKVVRGKVEETYMHLIDYMYTAEGKDVFNPKNLAVFNHK